MKSKSAVSATTKRQTTRIAGTKSYRFLSEGEIIQQGDEVVASAGDWKLCRVTMGRRVSNLEAKAMLFRRRIVRKPLIISELQHANITRSKQSFSQCDEWSGMEWGCALAGEAGEACNVLKKMKRDGSDLKGALADELADVICYASLIASKYGIDLSEAVRRKFNEVSDRVQSNIKL